jgi:hypothetical protein
MLNTTADEQQQLRIRELCGYVLAKNQGVAKPPGYWGTNDQTFLGNGYDGDLMMSTQLSYACTVRRATFLA